MFNKCFIRSSKLPRPLPAIAGCNEDSAANSYIVCAYSIRSNPKSSTRSSQAHSRSRRNSRNAIHANGCIQQTATTRDPSRSQAISKRVPCACSCANTCFMVFSGQSSAAKGNKI